MTRFYLDDVPEQLDLKMNIMKGEFGCSCEAMDRIAAALDMSIGQMAREGLDLEVLCCAWWLAEHGFNAETPKQVSASGAPIVDYPGFLEAVVIAAENLIINARPGSDR